MVPEIWSTADRTFCHFGLLFALLPTNNLKNQNCEKKMKKSLQISSLLTSVQKITIICYTVPGISHIKDLNLIFHFRLFFALLPPNNPKNQFFKKMKKNPGDMMILHMCTKNYDHMMYNS